ncbi:MAG: ABC transporter permease [Candidatus Nanohalobium sp.]
MFEEVKRHWRTYRKFFITFIKTKLVYKTDFLLGSVNQLVSLAASVAFIGLIFTQIESLQGWSIYELLFLTGVGRLILNIHGFFGFGPFSLGEHYIVRGRLDRYKVRPLNVLFQVYGSYIQTFAVSDIIASLALIAYTLPHLEVAVFTPFKVVYLLLAMISGVLTVGSVFLVFATTGFWTGRTKSIFRIFYDLASFRKYPLTIYSATLKAFFTAAFPIAFASFYPATFLLGKEAPAVFQGLTLVVGPFFYLLAYGFWSYGLSRYSSTGS